MCGNEHLILSAVAWRLSLRQDVRELQAAGFSPRLAIHVGGLPALRGGRVAMDHHVNSVFFVPSSSTLCYCMPHMCRISLVVRW